MKKFLKLFLCLSMLLSPEVIYARCNTSNDCDIACPTNCDVVACNDCSMSTSCESCSDDDCSSCFITPVTTFLHLRSQGANTARELVGWQWEINKPLMCNPYGSLYFAYEYQRSFKGSHLANGLFGGRSLDFSGSLVANRATTDLLADNLGLAQNFRGSVNFHPRIENHIFDFGYFLGLDCWLQGAYVRIHAPVVYSKWNLRADETSCTTSTTCIPSCYVGGTAVTPAENIQQALSGSFVFGDMQTPLCGSKVNFCGKHKVGLADIDFILGYNYFNTDCYHLGFYTQLVLPTGPRVNTSTLFAPQVGNNRHFELGVGISAHTVLFGSETHNLALFLEGNITHMFKNTQCRTFDYCNAGAFSRYMLLKGYDTTITPVYNGSLISATCFNTRDVRVKLNVKGDASIKLAYRWCGIGIDLGYNIYGHSRETIELRDSCYTSSNYAIKGTSNVCCFQQQIADVVVAGATISTIQPTGAIATLQTLNPDPTVCTTFPAVGSAFTTTVITNNGAQPNATAFTPAPVIGTAGTCNACLSTLVTTPTPVTSLAAAGVTIVDGTAPTRFVSVGDLNLRSGAAPAVLTHKAFGFINYTWFDECGANPNIGLGASVEVDGGPKISGCKKVGLSQWGILLKGGFSF